ncbi:MAG TPA: DUF1638 domain-containing protein [Ilumatobacteraceae bacterium]|nr:DUF1638 domain-containing protein [Ilumatobacteraceae bacterium]
MPDADATRPLVIACGALAGDLRRVLSANHLTDTIEVDYLPANYHNAPQRIVPELRPRIEAALAEGRPVLVGYADCGTGGRLDALLAEFPGVKRLPGDHCYEFFAGGDVFAAMQAEELGTFYLTDFLAKHFDALVWTNLGLHEHPELRDLYFGNYKRVMYLSQSDDPSALQRARSAAAQLGLEFEHRHVGRQGIVTPITEWSLHIRGTAV